MKKSKMFTFIGAAAFVIGILIMRGSSESINAGVRGGSYFPDEAQSLLRVVIAVSLLFFIAGGVLMFYGWMLRGKEKEGAEAPKAKAHTAEAPVKESGFKHFIKLDRNKAVLTAVLFVLGLFVKASVLEFEVRGFPFTVYVSAGDLRAVSYFGIILNLLVLYVIASVLMWLYNKFVKEKQAERM